ncbi:MAG: protein kinase [Myxococcales bacterium]|nr:protein kinase [Myxococcales bacterium]
MDQDLQDEIAQAQALVGRVLGDKFRLTALVGIGGSGSVFRADQLTLGRTVAVKILSPSVASDPRVMKRFHDEALAASRLNHPNTVSVIDYGQTVDGLLFIVMEYLRGPTLTQLITEHSPLPRARVLELTAQSLAGLEEAHLAGVVHADLKSDNIIVDQRRSGRDLVKLVDFGISRLVSAPRDGDDGAILGTPEYMAPELISGATPSFASDLYAVGVILYELITGRTPFFSEDISKVLSGHVQGQPAIPSSLESGRESTQALDAVCMRALAKHPVDRWASAAEMRNAILALREASSEPDLTCPQCAAKSPARFRFCPECGAPRVLPGGLGQPGRARPSMPLITAGAMVPVTLPASFVELLPDKELSQAIAMSWESSTRSLMVVGNEAASAPERVAAAAKRLQATQPHTLLTIVADPSGLHAPYYPLRHLLGTILRVPVVCLADALINHLTELGVNPRDIAGISEVFGHQTNLLELEPQARRREIVAATVRTLQGFADTARFSTVWHEIEQYDPVSMDVLGRLLAEPHPFAAMLVISPPAMAARFASLPSVNLGPLSPDERSQLTAQLPPELAGLGITGDFLAKETTCELEHIEHAVRYAFEGGEVSAVSPLLANMVASRLALLPHAALILAQTCAVFGRELPLATLRHVTSLSLEGMFDGALSVLTGRGLITISGEDVRFRSALVRDVVYDATPADVRRMLHMAAAEYLSGQVGDPSLLGHHYDLANDAASAAELLGKAGDLATHFFDDVTASSMYQRALRASRVLLYAGAHDDEVSVRRLIIYSVKLADCLRSRGELGLARGVLMEARDWCEGMRRLEAQVARALALLQTSEGDHRTAGITLRKAIGQAISCGDTMLVLELYLDLSGVLLRTGDMAAARRELQEGLDVATFGEGIHADAGPTNMWRVFLRLAQLAEAASEFPLSTQLGEAALKHARKIHARLGIARIQSMLAAVYERMNRPDLADRHKVAAVAEMRRLGDRRATAELLLSGASMTKALPRLSPSALEEARTLASEIGWSEGVRLTHSDAKNRAG